jgi:hypothetical protein
MELISNTHNLNWIQIQLKKLNWNWNQPNYGRKFNFEKAHVNFPFSYSYKRVDERSEIVKLGIPHELLSYSLSWCPYYWTLYTSLIYTNSNYQRHWNLHFDISTLRISLLQEPQFLGLVSASGFGLKRPLVLPWWQTPRGRWVGAWVLCKSGVHCTLVHCNPEPGAGQNCAINPK